MATTVATKEPVQQNRLQSLHPGWFGAVMGTAIVGVAAFNNPGNVAGLKPVMSAAGIAIAILTYVVAVSLGLPYLLRWIRHPGDAWRDLLHPVAGAMYATFPGGVLVLGVATAAIGPAILPPTVVYLLVAGLASVGGLLAFAISVAFAYLLFVNPKVAAESANGGWFIPPVVNIIVPLALMPLVPLVNQESGRLLVIASYAAWGAGFMLFLMVATLLYARLVHHPLPAAPLAPSLWIGLGPIGVGSLALIRMAQGGQPVWGDLNEVVSMLSGLGATAFWGFGVWWLAVAVLLLRRYVSVEGLPFGIGWWAFTFPLGAYTVATLTLARFWNLAALELLGVVLFAVLVIFWATVAARTLSGLIKGSIWSR